VNDPHVESLSYRLELLEPNASFKDPEPVTHATPDFEITLAGLDAHVAMNTHFTYDHEARAAVEPVLRAWEESSFLDGQHIRFDFGGATVIDRDPPRGEIGASVSRSMTADLRIAGSAEDYHEIGAYPAPPAGFALDPHVEALMTHVRAYREGRERLSDHAYWIYSYVTKVLARNRKEAAGALSVDVAVLRKLSELSSTIGDISSARKIDSQWQQRPFTSAEIAWLESTVTALVRQAGAIVSGTTPGRVRMGDLPQL
jgi:hypothetical protein